METLPISSTYALDRETASLIDQLAAVWHVSQAEVICRSVRIALANESPPVLTPQAVLEYYRTHPAPRDWQRTAQIVDALRTKRHEDDLRRTSERT